MSHGEKHVWLVVEDDSIIRSILRALMTLWDVEPLIFTDGFEAMRWLDQVERGEASPPLPDIALLDLRMPGPQGSDISQRMRTLPPTSGIPIIMMTAFHLTDSERIVMQRDVQADHLLMKPLPPPEELRKLINATIENSRPKMSTQPTHWPTIQAEIAARKLNQTDKPNS